MALGNQIAKPARGGNHHVYAAAEFSDLGILAHSAVEDHMS